MELTTPHALRVLTMREVARMPRVRVGAFGAVLPGGQREPIRCSEEVDGVGALRVARWWVGSGVVTRDGMREAEALVFYAPQLYKPGWPELWVAVGEVVLGAARREAAAQDAPPSAQDRAGQRREGPDR